MLTTLDTFFLAMLNFFGTNFNYFEKLLFLFEILTTFDNCGHFWGQILQFFLKFMNLFNVDNF